MMVRNLLVLIGSQLLTTIVGVFAIQVDTAATGVILTLAGTIVGVLAAQVLTAAVATIVCAPPAAILGTPTKAEGKIFI